MKPPHTLLACLTALAMAGPSYAQAPIKSLGAAKDGGPLLSREALRVCLTQQKDLAARKPALEAENDRLEHERRQFDAAGRALDAEREAFNKLQAEATELRRRGDDLAQKIADFNERAGKLQASGGSGASLQRQQQALEREKALLDTASKDLDADRAGLAARAEPQGKAYTERVTQRNQAAADWNTRNSQFTRSAQAYQVELADWRADCEGRRYREDDEKALQPAK